ncbi:hypothetical protein LJB89_03535 [Tyzzerella sp. OttesenSCG-928-J15]|nr:hypothetical protein [Tyzzerella sp. OttesenSCG-928-J15]
MNKIQKYFEYRQSLIDQYVMGDMSKSEYLEKNFDAVLALRREPFKYLDNVDKCLFNYQYYNAHAKEAKMLASASTKPREKEQYLREVDFYYQKKDSATLKALSIMDYKDVKAYFIRVRSKYLKGKLFEIQLLENNMILHSMNEDILNRLKYEGVFEEGTRVSQADMYINQKY